LIPNSGPTDEALEVFHWCRWYYGSKRRGPR
jgi:hypothetical protein